MIDSLISCFTPNCNSQLVDRFIKWNNGNHYCAILNVDGSCMGTPVRAGFGGVIRNNVGFYLLDFSGYIQDSSDILSAELYAIYQGLILAKILNIIELVCYSDSLHYINLLKGPTSNFHVYAILIQDAKDLIKQNNVIVFHTLREGNHCAGFMAKLRATLAVELLYHASPG